MKVTLSLLSALLCACCVSSASIHPGPDYHDAPTNHQPQGSGFYVDPVKYEAIRARLAAGLPHYVRQLHEPYNLHGGYQQYGPTPYLQNPYGGNPFMRGSYVRNPYQHGTGYNTYPTGGNGPRSVAEYRYRH